MHIICTGDYLGNRIRLDTNDVESNSRKTALRQHAFHNFHSFDFDNTTILAKVNQDKKRKIREMIEIAKDTKSVNFKSDLTISTVPMLLLS